MAGKERPHRGGRPRSPAAGVRPDLRLPAPASSAELCAAQGVPADVLAESDVLNGSAIWQHLATPGEKAHVVIAPCRRWNGRVRSPWSSHQIWQDLYLEADGS